MKKPIPARMVFWILSGTLLAFILFNMVSYYLLERVYSDRLASDNQIHTRNVALSVSSFYETVYAVVGEMAQAGEIRSLDPARQRTGTRLRQGRRTGRPGLADRDRAQRSPLTRPPGSRQRSPGKRANRAARRLPDESTPSVRSCFLLHGALRFARMDHSPAAASR